MILASGLGAPEGPVLLSDGSWLCVEMAPERGCVTHISADGKSKRVVAKTGRPNGLIVDKQGMIWVAETQTPALLCMTQDGQVRTAYSECEGKAFLFPNDLAFGPEGHLYLTDSGIRFADWVHGRGTRGDWERVPIDGRVYKINLRTKEVRLVDSGMRFTNGIAFGPDKNLYVNEMLTGNIYRYQWNAGEIIGKRELYGNAIDTRSSAGFGFCDGQKFDEHGNLYVAMWGQGEITIFGPGGHVIKRLKTRGQKPTNLAFGQRQSENIVVTEVEFGAMETHSVGVDGLALYSG